AGGEADRIVVGHGRPQAAAVDAQLVGAAHAHARAARHDDVVRAQAAGALAVGVADHRRAVGVADHGHVRTTVILVRGAQPVGELPQRLRAIPGRAGAGGGPEVVGRVIAQPDDGGGGGLVVDQFRLRLEVVHAVDVAADVR